MRAQFEKKDFGIKVKRVNGFKGFAPMFHVHMEIVFVIKGCIDVTVEGKSYALEAGQLSVIFPYVIHSYEDAPEAEAVILLFSVGAAEVFGQSLFSVKAEVPCIAYTEEMLGLAERLLYFRKPENVIAEKTARAYLSALVGEILQITGSREVPDSDLSVAQRILLYCSEHFKEDIDGKDVAKACFVSESYVTKIFAGKLRIPFRTYINQLRVAEAKQLLKKTDLKISDVMYGSGFKNQSSFNRIFMEETGMTPREYREKAEQEKKSEYFYNKLF